MPYPESHIIFFVFCISAVMVYSTLKSIYYKEFTAVNCINLLILFFVGGLAALLPDVPAVYNLIVYGTYGSHGNIGIIPTHSLLFSLTAILFGFFVGYVVYRRYNKAMYMSIYSESAFNSHLLLDDLARNKLPYFYPINDNNYSVFSYVDVTVSCTDPLYYSLGCYISLIAIFIVVMMALFSLEHLGFEVKSRSLK